MTRHGDLDFDRYAQPDPSMPPPPEHSLTFDEIRQRLDVLALFPCCSRCGTPLDGVGWLTALPTYEFDAERGNARLRHAICP